MKTAVILLNLGGPDSLEAVEPFLFNLFNDKAIINLPQPLRAVVAKFISMRRESAAKEIYEEIEGKSPLLENTQEQAASLEKELSAMGEYKVFIAMRYWHPFIAEAVAEVKEYAPEKVVLLPLYPQFSTTTTESSFNEWFKQAELQGLHAKHHPLCCYPFDNHLVEAHVDLIKPFLTNASKYGKPRILFSAHGLPKKIIEKGDPYQWQIERSVSAIVRKLGAVDHVICYQSRVGPMEWLGPSTEAEVIRATADGVPIIVVPISFVSEHSETLVELDIEYRRIANNGNAPYYGRVPALGVHSEFIKSLAWLIQSTTFYPNCSNPLGHQCPKEFGKCGFREWKSA